MREQLINACTLWRGTQDGRASGRECFDVKHLLTSLSCFCYTPLTLQSALFHSASWWADVAAPALTVLRRELNSHNLTNLPKKNSMFQFSVLHPPEEHTLAISGEALHRQYQWTAIIHYEYAAPPEGSCMKCNITRSHPFNLQLYR